MPPFTLKTSEPQFVQDLGNTASACPVRIPPRHTHTPAPGNQIAGWLDLALQSDYFRSKWCTSRRLRGQLIGSGAFWGKGSLPMVYKHWAPSLPVAIFALLFFPLHAATIPLLWLRCTVLTEAAWSQGVGRELLAARAGILPPVTHLPLSSASGDAAWADACADPTQASMNRASCRLFVLQSPACWGHKRTASAKAEREMESRQQLLRDQGRATDSHTWTSGTNAELMHGPSHPSCGSLTSTVLRLCAIWQLCQRQLRLGERKHRSLLPAAAISLPSGSRDLQPTASSSAEAPGCFMCNSTGSVSLTYIMGYISMWYHITSLLPPLFTASQQGPELLLLHGSSTWEGKGTALPGSSRYSLQYSLPKGPSTGYRSPSSSCRCFTRSLSQDAGQHVEVISYSHKRSLRSCFSRMITALC